MPVILTHRRHNARLATGEASAKECSVLLSATDAAPRSRDPPHDDRHLCVAVFPSQASLDDDPDDG